MAKCDEKAMRMKWLKQAGSGYRAADVKGGAEVRKESGKTQKEKGI